MKSRVVVPRARSAVPRCSLRRRRGGRRRIEICTPHRLMGRKEIVALEVAPPDVFVDPSLQPGSVAADLHSNLDPADLALRSIRSPKRGSAIKLNAGVTS